MPVRRTLMLLALLIVALTIPSGAVSASTPTPERVVYVSTADGDADVYTMNPDGSARVGPLTKNNFGDCDPVLSPDGKQIAWTTSTTQDHSEVWVMNADGSNPRQITQNPTEYVRGPSWSPSGDAIVFMRSVGYKGYGNSADFDIDLHVVRRTGTGWGAEETLLSTDAWEYGQVFSRDGRMAYVSDPDHGGPKEADIWLADSAGGNPAPLVTAPGAENMPSWSPDGTKLAYSRGYVYSFTLATRTETALTTNNANYPDWSTTRNEIIYTSGGDLYRLDMTRSPSRSTNLTKASKASDLDADW